MRAFGLSDIGKERKNNEDFISQNDDIKLYILADGMGGHKGGEIASKNAVESIDRYISDKVSMVTGKQTEEFYKTTIREAIEKANNVILDYRSQHKELGMIGTTVVLAWVRDGNVYVANVGDSRAYFIRNGAIKHITTDHTKAQELVNKHLLQQDDIAQSPLSNILTRSVGTTESVKPDIYKIPFTEEDAILLFTDGLIRVLNDADIKAIMLKSDLTVKERVEYLIGKTLLGDAPDNVTVLVIEGDDYNKNLKAHETREYVPPPVSKEEPKPAPIKELQQPLSISAGTAYKKPEKKHRYLLQVVGVLAVLLVAAGIGVDNYLKKGTLVTLIKELFVSKSKGKPESPNSAKHTNTATIPQAQPVTTSTDSSTTTRGATQSTEKEQSPHLQHKPSPNTEKRKSAQHASSQQGKNVSLKPKQGSRETNPKSESRPNTKKESGNAQKESTKHAPKTSGEGLTPASKPSPEKDINVPPSEPVPHPAGETTTSSHK
jgi:protein phosphatase